MDFKFLENFLISDIRDKIQTLKELSENQFETLQEVLKEAKNNNHMIPYKKFIETMKYQEDFKKNASVIARLFHVNITTDTVKKIMNMNGVLTSEDIENHLIKANINIPVIRLVDYKGEKNCIICAENKYENHWIALWYFNGKQIMFDSTGCEPKYYDFHHVDNHLTIKIQPPNTNECGYYCLWFVYNASTSEEFDMEELVTRWLKNNRNLEELNECIVNFVINKM